MIELIKQDFLKNKQTFEKLKQCLKNKLGKDVVIEHVGSTAIKNMYGKNIIDILIAAEGESEFKILCKKIEDMKFYPSQNSRQTYINFLRLGKKKQVMVMYTFIWL